MVPLLKMLGAGSPWPIFLLQPICLRRFLFEEGFVGFKIEENVTFVNPTGLLWHNTTQQLCPRRVEAHIWAF